MAGYPQGPVTQRGVHYWEGSKNFSKKLTFHKKKSRTHAQYRDRFTKWREGPRGKAHKGTGVSHYRVPNWKKHQQSHTHRVAKITAQSFN